MVMPKGSKILTSKIRISMTNRLLLLVVVLSVITLSQNGMCEVKNVGASHSIEGRKIKSGNDKFAPIACSYEDDEVKIFLLEMINSEEEQESKRIAAARVLGKVPLGNESTILVENFLSKYENSTELKELKKVPIPVAFIQTGIPARLSILNRIKNAQDDEEIKLYAVMLIKMEDKSIAKIILERAINQEEQENKKENLVKALAHIK
jgi:hypothetical protein